jgi:hypothetical protein
MAKSKDEKVKKGALSEESATLALQRIDEMMAQLSDRHAAALRKIAELERILPPEFGTFFPPARVVTGFLSIYVFHIVAMHMKYHLLQNGAVSNYN